MAFRCDFIEVRAVIDPNTGSLICSGTIARAGIQEYKTANGSVIREFRPPDEVEKSAPGFNEKIVTLDHPPTMVNASNSKIYFRGFTTASEYCRATSLVNARLVISDQTAIDAASSTHKQLSNGYECDIDVTPGEWQGQKYDQIQRNIRGNHIALVERARAGEVARLHLDSEDGVDVDLAHSLRFDSEDMGLIVVPAEGTGNSKKRNDAKQKSAESMKTTIRLDNSEWEVENPALATAVQATVKQRDEALTRNDSLLAEKKQLELQVQALTAENETYDADLSAERGRNDALEEKLETLSNAEPVEPGEVEDDSDDLVLDLDDLDEIVATGIAEGIEVREGAIELMELNDIDTSDISIPSDLSPAEVQAFVIETIRPGVKLDGEDITVDYVQARYDALWEDTVINETVETSTGSSARQDSAYTSSLKEKIAKSRQDACDDKPAAAKKGMVTDDASKRKMDACKQPLALSK